jgi:hypothetical protein
MGFADAADRPAGPGVLLDEVPPGGDDPSRVGAEVGHVGEPDRAGVRTERGPQRAQPGLGDRDHDGFVMGQSVADERHHDGQEVVQSAVQHALVPVRVVRPDPLSAKWCGDQ